MIIVIIGFCFSYAFHVLADLFWAILPKRFERIRAVLAVLSMVTSFIYSVLLIIFSVWMVINLIGGAAG